MRLKYILVVAVVLLCGSPAIQSQTVCGDADGNRTVNIGDIVDIFNYLTNPQGDPVNPGADCDNRLGVTIGDAQRITDYIFAGGNLDCAIQDVYTFPASLNDTIFLPFMVSIPDNVDSVKLPIITSFEAGTRSIYLPTQTYETNGPWLFNLSRINTEHGLLGIGQKLASDTAVMMVCEISGATGNEMAGRHSYFELVFRRVAPGLANIVCESVVRSESLNLRPSISKGGDLYAPVIQYYQVPAPTPKVTVSPAPLSMESESGYWSTVTYPVTFTSDMGSVSFNVAASDSWIAIENPSATYTTPATINIRADASALAPGSYAGQITFSNVSPANASFLPSTLDVALNVIEAMIYPPGDFNCDGQVSIGDIVVLIDCLFVNQRPIPTCR